MRKLTLLALFVLANCIPITLLSTRIRNYGDTAYEQYTRKERTKNSAKRCLDATSAGLQAILDKSITPGWVSKKTAKNIESTVQENCDAGSMVVDLGASRDSGQGQQDAARDGGSGQSRD